MADVNANIGINLDTKQALAQLQDLQRRISTFHQSMARSGSAANAAQAKNLQQNLQNNINATGQFTASLTKVKSTTETFTNSLEKNKLSMGQYFRYGAASTRTFGRFFSKEMNTINKVAVERVKNLQTQYIQLGRDASGAMRAMAIRPAVLDMDNLATKTAVAAQKQQIFNQLLKQGSTNLLNFGKNTQWAGRQLMVGFTIPLGIMGAAASRTFMDIEKQAIRFKRVYGDAFSTSSETEKALQDMKALALEFTKYGVAIEDTMALAADAAQMGLSGRELAAQVANATKLAVLGEVEQQEALQTSISVTNAFGIAADNLAEKINFLNAVENESVTAISDLTIAIPKAGPVIQQLGGSVEDLAFFLTAMKEGGINASEGANALKSGLAKLINPTQRARDMLNGMGIDITGIVEGNAGNIRETVIEFANALDELDPLNRARAIEQLFGKFQFARISTLFKNIVAEGNQAQRVLELGAASAEELAIISERELGRIEASPLFKFQKAMEEFQAALAPIGETFLKAVTPIIEFGTDILKKFNDMGDGVKNFAVITAGVLGGIAPVALMGFGLIANGIANMLKLLANLRIGFLKLKGNTSDLALGTEYLTQEQVEAQSVAASLQQSHSQLIQTFGLEESAINRLANAYNMATQQQRLFNAQSVSGGSGIVRATLNNRMTTNSFQNPLGLADGILSVPGPKGAGDVVPAMLSPGEAVLPADRVKKYGALIAGIMEDTVPGYQDSNITVKEGQSEGFISVNGAEYPLSSQVNNEEKFKNTAKEILVAFKRLGKNSELLAEELLSLSRVSSHAAKRIGSSTYEYERGTIERSHVSTKKVEVDGKTYLGSSTMDLLLTQNQALKGEGGGQSPEEFLTDYTALENKLLSTGTSAGIEDTPENRAALQDIEDRTGLRAAEIAESEGKNVNDSTLAQAYQEVLEESIQQGGTLEEIANLLKGREDVLVERVGRTTRDLTEKERGVLRSKGVEPGSGKSYRKQPQLATAAPGRPDVYEREIEMLRRQQQKVQEGSAAWNTFEQKIQLKRSLAAQNMESAANAEVQSAEVSKQSAEKGKHAAMAEADAAKQTKLTAEQREATAADEALRESRAVNYDEEEAQKRAEAARQQALNAEKEEQIVNEKAAAVDKSEQSASIEQAAALEEQKIDEIKEQAAQQEVVAAQKQVETAEEERRLLLQLHEEEKAAKRKAYRKLESNMRLYGKADGITSQEKSMRRRFQSDIDANQQPLTEAQKRKIGIRSTYGTKDFNQTQRWERKLEESKMRQLRAEERKAKISEQQAAQAKRSTAQQATIDNQQTQAKRRGLGLLQRLNQLRQRAISAEQIASMQTRVGAKVMGASIAASSLVGVTSMVGGPIGEISQQLMPIVFLLSGAASTMQMLPAKMLASFFKFLFSPMGIAVGALVAVLGTVAAITIANNKAIKEARNAAYDFTRALSASAESAKGFAEAAGTATRSEIIQRRRLGLGPILPGAEEGFGEQFLEGDFGQELAAQVQEALDKEGFEAASDLLTKQLNNAILQNAISPAQAQSIAMAIGQEVGDYSIPVRVNANIDKWTMPNGEELDLSQPIEAQVIVDVLGLAPEDLLEDGPVPAQELIDSSGELIAWWDTDEWKKVAELEGDTAASLTNQLEARQSALDILDESYGTEIERLQEAGRYQDALDKQREYEEQRLSLINTTNDALKIQTDLLNELEETDLSRARAVSKAVLDDIRATLGDDVAETLELGFEPVSVGRGPSRRVAKDSVVSQAQQTLTFSLLLSGNATEDQVNQYLTLKKELQETGLSAEEATSKLNSLGTDYGSENMLFLLDTVSGIADETARAAATDLILNTEIDPRAFVILSMLEASPIGEDLRTTLIIEVLGRTEEDLEAIQEALNNINSFEGEMSIDDASSLLLNDNQRKLLRSDIDYFNELSEAGKKAYLGDIIESGIADAGIVAGSDEYEAARARLSNPENAGVISQEDIEQEVLRQRQNELEENITQAASQEPLPSEAAKDILRDLQETGDISTTQQILAEVLIDDEDLGTRIAEFIVNNEGDAASIAAMVKLDARLGGKVTDQILDIISGIANPEDQNDFLQYVLDLSLKDPAKAQEVTDLAEILSGIEGGEGITGLVDFALANPEALTEASEEIDSLREQAAEMDKVSIEIVREVVGDDVANILAEDQAYFDGLPKDQQIVYTQILATLQVAASANIAALSDEEVLDRARTEGLISPMSDFKASYNIDSLRDQLAENDISANFDAIQNALGDMEFVSSTPGGRSGGAQLSTTLDGLLGQLRQFVSLGVDVREGWSDALKEIEKFAGGSREVFNGLNQQLRSVGAGQPLIDLIAGMDADEFEKRKNELFTIENDRITGLKQAAKDISEVMSVIKLSSIQDEQVASLQTINDQITAVTKLTAAGMNLEEAYKLVQDSAVAFSIANEENIGILEELVRVTNEATAATERFAFAQELEASVIANKEKSAIVQWLSENVENLNRTIFDAALGNDYISGLITALQAGELLTESELKEIENFFKNVQVGIDIDLNIGDIEFSRSPSDIYQEGMSNVNEKFAAMEQKLNISFQIATALDEETIAAARHQIEDINYEIDDYEAELERISWQEEDINEKYDDRIKALEEVDSISEKIQSRQQAQLTIAEALSRGDIAAAAKAVQEQRQREASLQIEERREQLEKAREQELGSLRAANGRTREEIEEKIAELKREIFEIEESTLEPAQERIRQAQRLLEVDIEALTVLGKSKLEWDKIDNAVKIATTSTEEFLATLKSARDIAAQIASGEMSIEQFNRAPSASVSLPDPAPEETPEAAPVLVEYRAKRGESLEGIASKLDNVTLQELLDLNPRYSDPRYNAGKGQGTPSGKNYQFGDYLYSNSLVRLPEGTDTAPLYRQGGGSVPSSASESKPYSPFKKRGTDTVPAMLTPGEYVVRRSAVNSVGQKFFDELNSTGQVPTQYRASGGAIGFGASGTPSYVTDAISQAEVDKLFSSVGYWQKQVEKHEKAMAGSRSAGEYAAHKEKLDDAYYFLNKNQKLYLEAKGKQTINKGSQSKNKRQIESGEMMLIASGEPSRNKKQDTFTPGGSNPGISTPDAAFMEQAERDKKYQQGGFQGFEAGFNSFMSDIGQTKFVQAIGNAYAADNIGGKIFRGAAAILSTPAEMIGSVVKNAIDGNMLPGIMGTSSLGKALAEGVVNAFSGVANAEDQRASMFEQAAQSAIENNFFGAAKNEELASLARIIGGSLNIVGDPLTYAGLGLVTKATQGTKLASNLAKGAGQTFRGIASDFRDLFNTKNPVASRFIPDEPPAPVRIMIGQVDSFDESMQKTVFGEFVDGYKIPESSRPIVFDDGVTDFSKIVEADIVQPTPQGLIRAALNNSNPFSVRNNELSKMLENFENGTIGGQEQKLLDDILAATLIDDAGKAIDFNPAGLATVIRSLSGSENANSLIQNKKGSLFSTIKDRVTSNKEESRGFYNPTVELADTSQIAAIRSLQLPVSRNADGTFTLQPSGSSPDVPKARSTIHFSLDDFVKDHMFGQWSPENDVLVSRLSSVIDENGLPYALNPVDTFFTKSPGESFTLPSDTVLLKPFKDVESYTEELIRRGLLEKGQKAPALMFDEIANDILYKMDAETNVAYDALKMAKEKLNTDTSPRFIDDHATSDPKFNKSLRNLASSLGLYTSKHADTPTYFAETHGVFGINDSLDSLRYAALRGKFNLPQPRAFNVDGSMPSAADLGNDLAAGGIVKGYSLGGGVRPAQAVKSAQAYMMNGGMFKGINTDTVPAMLTPGEFVVRKYAVEKYGTDKLKAINNGTYSGESVYNYSVNVNVKSESNPDDIARTVISHIKRIDSQKIRGNRF